MISCLHTCMHACCIISITPPFESQRSSCIVIKVCDRGLIDWWLGSIWPPAFSDVISHGPHQQSIHSNHTLILSSNLYLAWVVSILGWLLPSYYFFLQTLRGLEQCLLCDPWPVIHSHHVKRSHMGRIKLQWHINKYRWKIHYHWHNYSFSVNFKIFFVFYFLLFF